MVAQIAPQPLPRGGFGGKGLQNPSLCRHWGLGRLALFHLLN